MHLLIVAHLLVSSAQANPTDDLWAWVEANEALAAQQLDARGQDGQPAAAQQALIALNEQVAAVDPRLAGVYSTTRTKRNKYELVVTAKTDPSAWSLVHRTVDAAPKLKHFRVIAFQQPLAGDGLRVSRGEQTLAASEMQAAAGVIDRKLCVTLLIPKKPGDFPVYQELAVVLMDGVLGEERAMNISQLVAAPDDAPDIEGFQRVPLTKLPQLIDHIMKPPTSKRQ